MRRVTRTGIEKAAKTVRLEDLDPRRHVRGGAGKKLFGEQTLSVRQSHSTVALCPKPGQRFEDQRK
jgi:hypothetical protein